MVAADVIGLTGMKVALSPGTILRLLATIIGLLLMIAKLHRQAAEPVFGWLLLAAVFVFLAADEVVSIHERLNRPMRETFDTDGYPLFAWVIPYGTGVAAFGIVYLPFLARLPSRTMRLFIVAGATFVTGAIGMKMLGSNISSELGKGSVRYLAIMTIEELLEMFGIAGFIYAASDYLVGRFGPVMIRIDGADAAH